MSWCSSRSSHRDPVHPQRRLADADRYTLAVLAAGADPGIELKIVADHGDSVQVGRAVADQHGPLQRRAELAVFDFVRLRALKYIFAGGDIDLATTEIRGIDAVLHRGQDLR